MMLAALVLAGLAIGLPVAWLGDRANERRERDALAARLRRTGGA